MKNSTGPMRRFSSVRLVALIILGAASTASAQPESSSLPSAVQGIFDGIRKSLNPKLAELDRLYSAGRFKEAIEFLLDNATELSDPDRQKYTSALRKYVESERADLEKTLWTTNLDSGIGNLLSFGRQRADFKGGWRGIERRLTFFGINASALEEQHQKLFQSWELLAERELSSFLLRKSSDDPDAEKYNQLFRLIGGEKTSSICTAAIGFAENLRSGPVARCKDLVSSQQLQSLRLATIKTEVARAAGTSGALEKLERFSDILIYWKLSPREYRGLIATELPEIVKITESDLRSWVASAKTSQIAVIEMSSEPTQQLRREKRQSSFISGRQVTPNPDYLDLQRRHSELNLEYQNCLADYRIQSLRNPYALNLCIIAVPNLNTLSRALSSTSPTITQTLTTPYEYDIDTLEISVKSRYAVIIPSFQQKQSFHKIFEETRKRTFVFARNLHQNDETVKKSSFASESEVKDFINISPAFDSEALLNSLNKKELIAGIEPLMREVSSRIEKRSEPSAASRVDSGQAASSAIEMALSKSIVVVNARGTLGTGFYVRPRYILTNEHVVENQSTVEIELKDGAKLTGVVVATDQILDLALIVVAQNGVALELSKIRPKPGQEVYALGHPRGLKFSLTRGIISAVRGMRIGPANAATAEFIQTDVAINPGNSGGPLLLDGRVVGINTFKIGGRDTQGLGFALASSEVLRWLEKNLSK
jgi:S1-C subfamily serine protease